MKKSWEKETDRAAKLATTNTREKCKATKLSRGNARRVKYDVELSLTKRWVLHSSDDDDSVKIPLAEWFTLRKLILRRDNYTCRDCGANDHTTKLQVHHQTPITKGGNNDWDNLITLCTTCHLKSHIVMRGARLQHILSATRRQIRRVKG